MDAYQAKEEGTREPKHHASVGEDMVVSVINTSVSRSCNFQSCLQVRQKKNCKGDQTNNIRLVGMYHTSVLPSPPPLPLPR